MNPLLALNHRALILDALPAGGTMLEWGSGGSTAWFLANLRDGQKLVSVEHDDAWLGQCEAMNHARPGREQWTPLLRQSTLPVGKNATHWEECPAGLEKYIMPLSRDQLAAVDVFLVDGVARAACMAMVAMHGKSGAAVFCHDFHRDWYDWVLSAPRFTERKLVNAEPGEYPPPLWCAKLL